MKYKTSLLRIKNIAGMHYSCGDKSKNLVIYAIGAPITPDNGTLPDAPYLMDFQTDIFVPDYIGFGRSDGRFTPKNCILTLLSSYESFKKGCIAKNYYSNKKISLRYDRIIFIGRSFGGTYVPLLPRYNDEISELALFSAVVDSKSCGSVAGEESNSDFLRSMRHDGYHHLYRGILAKIWRNHLENKDDLSPVDNINSLKGAKLFIAHGKQDMCVNYSKSVAYYNKILKLFPERKFFFKLNLYDGDHGPSTTNKASSDFMRWVKIPMRK